MYCVFLRSLSRDKMAVLFIVSVTIPPSTSKVREVPTLLFTWDTPPRPAFCPHIKWMRAGKETLTTGLRGLIIPLPGSTRTTYSFLIGFQSSETMETDKQRWLLWKPRRAVTKDTSETWAPLWGKRLVWDWREQGVTLSVHKWLSLCQCFSLC